MFAPGTSRARRVLLTTAAAAVVVLLPTACDYAVAAPSTGYGGNSGPGAGLTSDPVTVPVGQTQDADPSSVAADPSSADPSSVAADPSSADPSSAAADPSSADPSSVATDPSSVAADPVGGEEAEEPAASTTALAPPSSVPPSSAPPAGGGGALAILGDDCSNSLLEPHDGFQLSPRCVSTAGGEVAAVDLSPSLLITDAPESIASGQTFTLTVSTRNLIRDRFLGAAAGGYYRESSFLSAEGVQRGHFHTACRMLATTDVAPDSSGAPQFFLATQDLGGGTEPDQVTITVTGLTGPGIAQCAVWAGDGSHRVPMMTRANQTPAFDVVRITVE